VSLPPDTRRLRLPAYAKINLSLEILGKRPDGFHELVSVTQIIALADRITVTPDPELRIITLPPVVNDNENIVRRAALALGDATGQSAWGQVRLEKHIPLAAGLGGGSSDAAATLRLLNRLWGCRVGQAKLAEIAAHLGSDVPLFLGAGTSLIRGRGERVEALPPAPPFWLVLVCSGGAPPDKTRAMYGALAPAAWSHGGTTLELADRIRAGLMIDGAVLVNSFDSAANEVYPGFVGLRRRLHDLSGLSFHLTGAGPTLFAPCSTARQARDAVRTLTVAGIDAQMARSVARRPSIRASGAPLTRFTG